MRLPLLPIITLVIYICETWSRTSRVSNFEKILPKISSSHPEKQHAKSPATLEMLKCHVTLYLEVNKHSTFNVFVSNITCFYTVKPAIIQNIVAKGKLLSKIQERDEKVFLLLVGLQNLTFLFVDNLPLRRSPCLWSKRPCLWFM